VCAAWSLASFPCSPGPYPEDDRYHTRRDITAKKSRPVQERLPHRSVQIRTNRANWWSGPDLFLIVDDYELCFSFQKQTSPSHHSSISSPRHKIRIHIVLARGFDGAGRSMFDPLLARLRETGNPGLIMSGSGPVVGPERPLVGCALPPGRGILGSRPTSPCCRRS
jgi:DNA segregation ATPase FtsK/SpoIIIE, S-DNA-T family